MLSHAFSSYLVKGDSHIHAHAHAHTHTHSSPGRIGFPWNVGWCWLWICLCSSDPPLARCTTGECVLGGYSPELSSSPSSHLLPPYSSLLRRWLVSKAASSCICGRALSWDLLPKSVLLFFCVARFIAEWAVSRGTHSTLTHIKETCMSEWV